MWAHVGIFSLVLVFPGILLAVRLAQSPPVERTPSRTRLSALVLTLLGAAAGLGLHHSLIPIFALFFYVVLSGIHIVRFGQGIKRFAVALGLIVWTIALLLCYIASAG